MLQVQNRFFKPQKKEYSNFVFFLLVIYFLDFFLHTSARLPPIADFRPTLLLTIIIFICLLIRSDIISKTWRHPGCIPLNIFLIYVLLSLPLVEWPGSVIRDNFIDYMKAIVFFYFTIAIVTNVKRLKIIFWVFISCQIYRVIEPLFMHVVFGYMGSSTYIGGGEYAGRLSGSPYDIINPNELGFVTVTSICFIHYFFSNRNTILKLFYLCFLSLMIYVIILTLSRGAMISLIFVFMLIIYKTKYKALAGLIFVIFSIIGFSSMSELQKDRFLSIIQSNKIFSKSVSGRFDGFKQELEITFNKPFFGHGLGTSPEARVNILGGKLKASHTFYAELVVEVGIFGAAIFLWYIFRILSIINRSMAILFNNSKDPPETFEQRLSVSLKLCFWMYLLFSLNYYGLNVHHWYLIGALAIVLATIASEKIQKDDKATPSLTHQSIR